ncbi:MAG: hypothetical protein Kow0096_23920 [Thiohalomonadaceae bacterium]
MRSSSELLHQGWTGNLTTLRELQLFAGLSNEDAARLCLVSPETYRRWRRDRSPNPTAVRLLAVLAGYVPWRGWDGWEVHSGLLFPPGYSRHGVAPADILALPFTLQLLAEVQRQAKITRSEPAEVLPVKGRSL